METESASPLSESALTLQSPLQLLAPHPTPGKGWQQAPGPPGGCLEGSSQPGLRHGPDLRKSGHCQCSDARTARMNESVVVIRDRAGSTL